MRIACSIHICFSNLDLNSRLPCQKLKLGFSASVRSLVLVCQLPSFIFVLVDKFMCTYSRGVGMRSVEIADSDLDSKSH